MFTWRTCGSADSGGRRHWRRSGGGTRGDRRCRGPEGRVGERTDDRGTRPREEGGRGARFTGKTGLETRPTDRRVVQSGPTRGGWPSRGGLRAPNAFAWPITERRPTERTDKRQSPLHGGPALALWCRRRFLRWCVPRQCGPPRNRPLWTTLHAIGCCKIGRASCRERV